MNRIRDFIVISILIAILLSILPSKYYIIYYSCKDGQVGNYEVNVGKKHILESIYYIENKYNTKCVIENIF